MSEIILIRIEDKSQKEVNTPEKAIKLKIELPAVLGRGATLKCPDKKVSRNHATLDWEDEGVLITSTHINPTFIIINGKEKSLLQGQSVVLNDGDRFGLLQETYWYKVTLKSLQTNLATNSVKNIKLNSPLPPKEQDHCNNINGLKTEEFNKGVANDCNTESNNSKADSKIEPTIDTRKSENKIKEEEKKDIKRNRNFDTEDVVDSNKRENDVIQKEDVKNNIENEEDKERDTMPEVSSINISRERVLPKWMTNTKLAKSSEQVPVKGTGTVHGENRKRVRTSKPPQKPKKLHECNDDPEDDQSISAKQTLKVKKESPKKQTKATKKTNQYHNLSQDFDSPEIENEISKKNVTKNKNPLVDEDKKSSVGVAAGKDLHAVSDDDEDMPSKNKLQNSKNKNQKSPIKVNKRSPQKSKNAAKKPNQYHTLSQDFDTEIPEEKATAVTTKAKKSSDDVPAKVLHSVSDDEEDIASKKKNSDSKLKLNKNSLNVSENESDDNDANSGGKEKKKVKTPRKSCEYGEECYRTNPKHRKEMAHPGDADYNSNNESASEDEDDDRPECEYGVTCYRKNPQHRTSFKHTKKPQPPRNAKRKAKGKGYEDGDSENEYDFDDPFLNDDSSDDYAPTDSSGPDSEIEDAVAEDDTTRMNKEAKKFVKKRKY